MDIANLLVNEGEHIRQDCPECGGENTLSVSKINGTLIWHCFRGTCKTKGASRVGYSLDDAANYRASQDTAPFVLPERLLPATANKAAVDYLVSKNCVGAYRERRADIRYDPELDRIVFVIRENGNAVGACGRSLHRGSTSKWFRYDRGDHFYLVKHKRDSETTTGKMGSVVLVEDSASACAASNVMDSIGLLGIKLPGSILAFLSENYNNALLALDPDYAGLSHIVSLHRRLSWYIPTKIVILEKEFKELNDAQIEQVLGR